MDIPLAFEILGGVGTGKEYMHVFLSSQHISSL